MVLDEIDTCIIGPICFLCVLSLEDKSLLCSEVCLAFHLSHDLATYLSVVELDITLAWPEPPFSFLPFEGRKTEALATPG